MSLKLLDLLKQHQLLGFLILKLHLVKLHPVRSQFLDQLKNQSQVQLFQIIQLNLLQILEFFLEFFYRKTPEKIQVSKEDLAELSETAAPEIDSSVGQETMNEQGEVSLDEVSESENQEADVASEDPEASNS